MTIEAARSTTGPSTRTTHWLVREVGMRGYRSRNRSIAIHGVANQGGARGVALTGFERARDNPATVHSPNPARGTTPIGSRRIALNLRALRVALLVAVPLLLSLALVAPSSASAAAPVAASPSPERVRTLAQDVRGATFEYV